MSVNDAPLRVVLVGGSPHVFCAQIYDLLARVNSGCQGKDAGAVPTDRAYYSQMNSYHPAIS